MIETDNFGHLVAKNIKIGDLVSWKRWNSSICDWDTCLGVVLEVKNTILGNRMVCISMILPLKGPQIPIEIFTFSLNLVSSGGIQGDKNGYY
jgi:hypothetical protein